jgi:hypothetical protein
MYATCPSQQEVQVLEVLVTCAVHALCFQLTFDTFTLGRFTSFTADGCPDGSLQIKEADRPVVGGAWCGTSWGAALYYSETRTVRLSLYLTRLARDQTGYNFDCRMGYKMLPRDTAIVRYGGPVPGQCHTLSLSWDMTPCSLVRSTSFQSSLLLSS